RPACAAIEPTGPGLRRRQRGITPPGVHVRAIERRAAMSVGAAAGLLFCLAYEPATIAQPNDAAPTEGDWRALASLPDFNGVWIPDVTDQRRRERGDPAPWTAAAGEQIEFLFAEEDAGRPKLVLDHCLPHGMPSWMLITHNAME